MEARFLRITLVLALITRAACARAASPTAPPPAIPSAPVAVWPEGKMPGQGAKESERDTPAKGDGFKRITNISQPTLTLFPAPAMIVCPGGGYSSGMHDKEGTEIAAWLNANCISALVLKYRTPNNRAGALQDLQRALSLTRARSADWRVEADRIRAAAKRMA